MARLTSLDFDKKFSDGDPTPEQQEWAKETLALTEDILGRIQPEQILAHAAIKHDARQDAAELKKEMDKQRNWYLEALAKRGLAQLSLADSESATGTLFDLMRVTEVASSSADARVSAFAVAHAQAVGHHARAFKLTSAQLESKPGQLDLEKR